MFSEGSIPTEVFTCVSGMTPTIHVRVLTLDNNRLTSIDPLVRLFPVVEVINARNNSLKVRRLLPSPHPSPAPDCSTVHVELHCIVFLLFSCNYFQIDGLPRELLGLKHFRCLNVDGNPSFPT